MRNQYKVLQERYNVISENRNQVIWHGSCDTACKGPWVEIEPVGWDYIKSLFNTNSYVPDARGADLRYGEQDIRLGGEGAKFPLRCYMPYTFEEFKKLLEAGELIRFVDHGTYYFNIFSFDMKVCRRETQETLNTLSDFVAMDF